MSHSIQETKDFLNTTNDAINLLLKEVGDGWLRVMKDPPSRAKALTFDSKGHDSFVVRWRTYYQETMTDGYLYLDSTFDDTVNYMAENKKWRKLAAESGLVPSATDNYEVPAKSGPILNTGFGFGLGSALLLGIGIYLLARRL
jgi:3-oxoacyl-ACP reductase-like protein